MRCPRPDCYDLNMKYSLMIHALKAQVPALAIFSVAVVKWNAQKVLLEQRVDFSLWFQSESLQWQGRNGSRWQGQEAEITSVVKQRANWEKVEAISSQSSSTVTYFLQKAAPLKGSTISQTVPQTGDQVVKYPSL